MDPVVVAALIAAFFTLLAVMLRVVADSRAIRHQVQNSHKTDLRSDLDEIHADIRDLHSDVRSARSELRAAERDADREHKEIWNELNKR